MIFNRPLSAQDIQLKKDIENSINGVKRLKQEKGLSYKRIAQIIGINESTFRGWLSYRQHTINPEAYQRLLAFLAEEQERTK